MLREKQERKQKSMSAKNLHFIDFTKNKAILLSVNFCISKESIVLKLTTNRNWKKISTFNIVLLDINVE